MRSAGAGAERQEQPRPPLWAGSAEDATLQWQGRLRAAQQDFSGAAGAGISWQEACAGARPIRAHRAIASHKTSMCLLRRLLCIVKSFGLPAARLQS